MTNEKINEMWTKLTNTKLDGTRAATILKKFMTKEEHAAYTKESLEYIQNHPECMDTTKKFDKAVNAIVLKHVESHKFADAKKLMTKIATFVEKIANENCFPMPEIVFDATACNARKRLFKLSAIMLLYSNGMTEEETFMFLAHQIEIIYSAAYGKEIKVNTEEFWNDDDKKILNPCHI